jgi:hypothetical protein
MTTVVSVAKRAWLGVFASVVWALCFRIGVQRELLYLLLTPTAVALLVWTLWWSPRP